MSKLGPLAAGVHRATGGVLSPAPQPAREPTATPRKPKAAAKPAALKSLIVRLTPAAHRQLKSFAAIEGRSVQDCMEEALDEFFEKYKKPQIARKSG